MLPPVTSTAIQSAITIAVLTPFTFTAAFTILAGHPYTAAADPRRHDVIAGIILTNTKALQGGRRPETASIPAPLVVGFGWDSNPVDFLAKT